MKMRPNVVDLSEVSLDAIAKKSDVFFQVIKNQETQIEDEIR